MGVDSTMESLLKFLNNICNISSDDTEKIPSDRLTVLCQELEEIYSDQEFRHSYYLISKQLEQWTPDVYASLTATLLQIIDFFRETRFDGNEENSRRILKSMRKLIDHVELEGLRLDRMKAVAHYSEEALSSERVALSHAESISSQWKDINKNVEEVKKQVKSYHSQSVTILGIFSALVLSVASEISVFSSAFSELSGDNFLMILFFVSFLGLVIFDTIFMLMYTVSKIVGISISVSSDPGNCLECPNHTRATHKRNLYKLWKKYPYVVGFNVLLILSTSVFGGYSLWYLKR